ncbi:MAG: hypothetical protein LRS43_04510 [Desulfurococcales archaeon]|nr:hypothetical protein [Desulfurococcales archaeon]
MQASVKPYSSVAECFAYDEDKGITSNTSATSIVLGDRTGYGEAWALKHSFPIFFTVFHWKINQYEGYVHIVKGDPERVTKTFSSVDRVYTLAEVLIYSDYGWILDARAEATALYSPWCPV